MAPLPDDLQRILDDLAANEHRAEALVRDLDEAQIAWQPAPTSWSIAQCLDHINVANHTYLVPMRAAVEAARQRGRTRQGPIRQGFVDRWFVQSLEPPPRYRLPAPKKIFPALGKGKEEIWRDFLRIHAEARGLLLEAAGLDLNRTRFANPFLPLVRFSVGTGFLVIPAHERRHLWQAEGVRARAGFPPAKRAS